MNGAGRGFDAFCENERALCVGALGVALLLQGLFFAVAVYRHRGEWLYSDAVFYDAPAWNLVRGRGLSYARDHWEDPDLVRWYHARHPEAISSPFVPAATFPPGYSLFLAAIYSLVGRNHAAAVLANGVLVWATVLLTFLLARRAYGSGMTTAIVLVLVGSYPMWAYWASRVLSDVLHVFLLTLFAVVWFTDRTTMRRAILAGLLLGLAVLVRPYALLLPAFLGVAGRFFRFSAFRLRYVIPLALAMCLPVGAWVARNYRAFGTPIFVSIGPGYGLWLATREPGIPSPDWERSVREELRALGIRQVYWRRENLRLRQLALDHIRHHPVRYILLSLAKTPRRWIHVGTYTPGWGKIALGVYFGVGFALLVAGLVLVRPRSHVVVAGSVVIVLYYSLIFLPLHVEARYLLPARPFAFVISAPAVLSVLRLLRIGSSAHLGERRAE